jgi:exopolysaccharide biosynthesis polyprenyl glycosylphosphotransferase
VRQREDGSVCTPVSTIAPPQPRAWRLLGGRHASRTQLTVDLVVLYLAVGVSMSVQTFAVSTGDLVLALSFPLITIAVMSAGRSSQRLRADYYDIITSIIGSTSLATMLVIAIAAICNVGHPLELSVRLWLYGSIYLGTARTVLLSLRRRAVNSEAFATPVLIVGAGVIGSHLARRLAGDPSYGLRPVGLIDSDPLPSHDRLDHAAPPVLGGLDDLATAVQDTGARHVILAFSGEPDHLLASEVRRCQQMGITVSLIPRLYESMNERTVLDHVGGLPMLTLHAVDPHGWQFAIKHAMDFGVAAVTLILTTPLMIMIAIATKLSSPGPVLYRQARIGRDGHEFDVLKFRTMRLAPAGASEATFALPHDLAPGGVEGTDRRTRLGRVLRDLSLDELPQLINVLRGDMSLVGPRPERPEYVARFAVSVVGYENRHRVRSGITGWAQVHGLRGQTSISDRVEWDNYYILNWSLRLDLRIIAMTIAEIFRFREG